MAKMPEIILTYVGDVERLRLLPGDVGVVKIKGRLRKEDVDRIKAQWEMLFPANEVLVLDESAEVSVMTGRTDDAPEPQGGANDATTA